MTLIHISAPHFDAGLWLDGGRVRQTAPILHYMRGWSVDKMDRYCQRKGWRWSGWAVDPVELEGSKQQPERS